MTSLQEHPDKDASLAEKEAEIQTEQAEDIDALPDPDYGRTEEEKCSIDRKLVRKIDFRIIPWLSFLYLLSFLDRTNIGNARLAGLEVDLGMKGHDYNVALSVFFVSYAIAEAVTNVFLKRLTPRVFFMIVMILWGFITTMMGLVTSFAGLVTGRFFLGLAEAGLFPGAAYYMSFWYRRDELGIRVAVFFSMAALAGSFGGLLAAAISKMDGIGAKSGWAWIFILEGLATIIVGISCWWMVPNWPDTAHFLTEDDRIRLRRRLAKDKQSSTTEAYDKRHIFAAFKDWKTWGFGFVLVGAEIALYAFSLFLPTIMAGLGYAGTHAQLLTVPPYACAAVVTIFVGWVADRTRCRGCCNMGCALLGMTGFVLLLSTPNPRVQYAGTFLAALGIYPTIPNTTAWVSNDIEGVYKRGVVIGIVVGCGNINGIVSSNIYVKSEKPRYWAGHGTVLAALTVFLLDGSLLMHILLRIENAKRLAGKRDRMHEGKSADELWVAGDNRPDFVYTL